MQVTEMIDIALEAALARPRPMPGRLSLAEAGGIARRAEARAREIGVPVAISVVDAEGQQTLFLRMEESLPAATTLATDKAWTAAAFRMGTHALGRAAQPGEVLFGVEATHGGRVVIFGGGLPLARNGVICGAIGISGGSVDEDMDIARHALGEEFEQPGQGPKTE